MDIKDVEYRLSNARRAMHRYICNGVSLGQSVEWASDYWHVTIRSLLEEYHAFVDMRRIQGKDPQPSGDPQ